MSIEFSQKGSSKLATPTFVTNTRRNKIQLCNKYRTQLHLSFIISRHYSESLNFIFQ